MTLKPLVKAFYEKSSGTISYIVQDPSSNNCAVIDSVLNFEFASGRTSTESADEIISYLEQKNLFRCRNDIFTLPFNSKN